jgi:hypothetical protein
MITITWWQLVGILVLIFVSGMACHAFIDYYKNIGKVDGGKP